jgi:sulfoxide reductase catalytic subunit YedY
MFIKRRRGWELPESAATPESVFRQRRRLIQAAAAGPVLLAAAPFVRGAWGAPAGEADPTAHLYPVPRNETYRLDRALTEERWVTTYNNFYEFGSHKEISEAAQALPIRPWTVTIDGLVEKPVTVGIDELVARMPLEERLYRHRCVEAKYLEMQTFENADVAPGQKQFWYPWPYVEGLTIAEATNELAFIATGLYGKPVPKQNGAPLRLAVPWKYGFKSIKSIVRFTFTEERPKTFWEVVQPKEYGFWANVNPEVPHPRWSQAREKVLGTDEKVPTQLFNGYGEFVAHLYEGLKGEKLYM